jgi:hypothetical protein
MTFTYTQWWTLTYAWVGAGRIRRERITNHPSFQPKLLVVKDHIFNCSELGWAALHPQLRLPLNVGIIKSLQTPSISTTYCSCESTGLTPINKMKPYSFKYVVANYKICEPNWPTCSASFNHFVMSALVRSFEGSDSKRTIEYNTSENDDEERRTMIHDRHENISKSQLHIPTINNWMEQRVCNFKGETNIIGHKRGIQIIPTKVHCSMHV